MSDEKIETSDERWARANKIRALKQKSQSELSATPCSTASDDLRSPLAKARDEWFASKEGQQCTDLSILKAPNQLQYLENRLEMAFIAGANWGTPKR